MDALGWFRILFADRPLALFALLLLTLASATRLSMASSALTRHGSAVLTSVAVFALVAYAGIAIWYASIDQYFDPAEATVTAVGWIVGGGAPVYHAPEAAERYSHIYGPLLFLAHAAVLHVVSPTIEASKFVGVAAALASLWFTWAALRLRARPHAALVLVGVAALLYLTVHNYTFWTRPEPLLLLAVAAGLRGALAARPAMAWVAVVVAAACAVDLKISGVLYAAPLYAIIGRRLGSVAAITALAATAALALLPFALPNVSMTNYAAWLSDSGATGLRLGWVRLNVEWTAFLGLPLVGWIHVRDRTVWRNDAWTMAALCGGAAAVILLGSKPGAGFYHLFPFIPVVLYLAAPALEQHLGDSEARRERGVLIAAFVATAFLIAAYQQFDLLRALRPLSAENVAGDIREFAVTHGSDRAAVGYGETYRLSFYRPLLVMTGGPYLIDAPAVAENQLAGHDVPQATLDAIRSCRVSMWLIPRGEQPFALPNGYFLDRHTPLFSDRFRDAFRSAYRKSGETTRYFDVWRCAGQAGR